MNKFILLHYLENKDPFMIRVDNLIAVNETEGVVSIDIRGDYTIEIDESFKDMIEMLEPARLRG